ncbi:glutamate--tRNA ligase [Sphingomonas sp. SFZ2018-12]|uniref:glutamate--tRNA ligase n=2 Tax=unclassified Sphingomonas TaxID=196159 RepID=UPI001F110AAC|nr:glutamate--tRNA ligase [Sphingomonas sp. SFZ2018-12]MCH4893861.1 glutamate--tRNA ligase [Sphingomonas sp. SFZ2018-12]
MTIITRFAPSPTGQLHVGNLRTALLNWMAARRAGGRFLLRIDDTDAERSREGHVVAIRDDLAWLGMRPDAEVRQSDRFALYERRFRELAAAGHVYPAYETPEELDLKRKVQLGRGLPPVYDRAALKLSDDDRARLEGEGVRPHWRFRMNHDGPIVWDDGVRGPQRFDPALMSDPVVRRADGSWLYLLPSVIDDIDMGITDVVRGEDHVTNTAAQLQMFAALGTAPPRFAHVALLTGAEGKLSKRLGSLGCDQFRLDGIEPMAILSLLARIGTSDPVRPFASAEALAEQFDLSHFGRAPARFDEAELAQLNARLIHQLDYAAVRHRLPDGMDAAAWQAIRPNLERVADAADWWRVIESAPAIGAVADADRDFLRRAAEMAGEIDWSNAPWAALTAGLKAATERKGRALFLPLRLALTGREHGPDMAELLPLIGRDRAIARLAAAAG